MKKFMVVLGFVILFGLMIFGAVMQKPSLIITAGVFAAIVGVVQGVMSMKKNDLPQGIRALVSSFLSLYFSYVLYWQFF